MTAKYQFFRNPPSQGQDADKETTLHARIVCGETVDFQELCERIAGRNTFSEGEVMGIMNLFKEEMIRALSDGVKVEVEGIGTYEATAQCPIRKKYAGNESFATCGEIRTFRVPNVWG